MSCDLIIKNGMVVDGSGIPHVVVGGQVVMHDGKHTGAFPGRVLRAPRRR